MHQLHTCPHGHTWQSGPDRDTSVADDCPVCLESDDFPPLPDLSPAAVRIPAVLADPAAVPAVPGYELLEELGRGGMGVVYRARQLKLNRLVALKMIRTGAGAGTAERERFRAEAEAIARLRHPNVVQVYDVGEAGGQPFLALEYVDGGSLSGKLSVAPLRPTPAAELLLTVARAVHDTHQAGVVHRDLKPENVLLTAAGTPKIGDFGLARLLGQDSHLTRAGAVLGTPAYMAPEQAGGAADAVGPVADVYALGAVLYETLTGRPPFRGASPLDTLDQVKNLDPVPPRRLVPGLPRDLETVCLKCLQKEPAKRYATAGDLADDLQAFLRGQPIRARPAGPAERLLKWARRRPWVAGLSGLVAVLVVGGFAGALYYQWQLRAALDTADRQRVRAEANYRKVQEAVDALLVQVGERELAPVPEMEEVRAKLLERALRMYQELLNDQDTLDPPARRQVARTHRRTADILHLLGRLPDAERHARRGLELSEELVAEFPDDAGDRTERAWAAFKLGTVLASQGRTAEAGERLSRAVELAEELPADSVDRHAILVKAFNELGNLHTPTDPAAAEGHFRRALDHLATRTPEELAGVGTGIRFNLGMLAQTRGRNADAEAAYREALAELEPKVAAAAGRVGNGHALLADVHHNLGVLVAGRDAKAALEHLETALDLHAKLHARNPKLTQFRRDAAGDREVLAQLNLGANRPAEAITHLTAAVALRVELVGDTPERPDDAIRLGNDYVTLGMLLSQQGKKADAAASYQKCEDLFRRLRVKPPTPPGYAAGMGTAALFRGQLHAEAKEWNEALACCDRGVTLLDEAYKAAPADPFTRVRLQGVYLLRAEVNNQLGRTLAALADLARGKQLDPPKP